MPKSCFSLCISEDKSPTFNRRLSPEITTPESAVIFSELAFKAASIKDAIPERKPSNSCIKRSLTA